MSNKSHSYTRIVATLAVTIVVAAFAAQPVAAQTAKKLNCTGCVKSKQLRNNGIKGKDIKDGEVGNADLGTNAVTGDKIADDAVGASEVAGDSIPATDLLDEAGGAFAGGEQNFILTTNGQLETIRSVTVTAPSSGLVIVNASGGFNLAGAGPINAECSLAAGPGIDDAARYPISAPTSQGIPVAMTRGFQVGPGSTTFNFICVVNTGIAAIVDSHMTAIFLPTSY